MNGKIIDIILMFSGLSLLVTGAVWQWGVYGLFGAGLALVLLSLAPAPKSATDRLKTRHKGGV